MAYFGIAMIIAIAYFIEWLEVKTDEKQTTKIERTHEHMYELIDEQFEKHEARERKAQVDAMIGALYKDNGKEYKPKNIKQVTTAEERDKRIKAELNGTTGETELLKAQMLDALDGEFGYPDNDKDDWYYEEHTHNEKREHLINYYISKGFSREEAEANARNFFEFAKGI